MERVRVAREHLRGKWGENQGMERVRVAREHPRGKWGENQGMERVRVAREHLRGKSRGRKKSISYRPQVPAFDTIEQKNEIVKLFVKKLNVKMIRKK